jgi:hypothetical protein
MADYSLYNGNYGNGLAYTFEQACKHKTNRPFFQLIAKQLLTWANYNRIKPETLRWLGEGEEEIERIREENRSHGIQ